jgi:SnoaL-like polyketide cyclase
LYAIILTSFVNKQNLNIADVNFAPEFVDHGTDVPPGMRPGPEGAKQYVGGAYKKFPDILVTIEDMVAEDDKVVVRNGWRGTERDGKVRLEFSGIVIWRIAYRQLVERWAYLKMPKPARSSAGHEVCLEVQRDDVHPLAHNIRRVSQDFCSFGHRVVNDEFAGLDNVHLVAIGDWRHSRNIILARIDGGRGERCRRHDVHSRLGAITNVKQGQTAKSLQRIGAITNDRTPARAHKQLVVRA